MNSVYASLSLILAEAILLLLVVCGALIFIKLRDQRKDKKALSQLTQQIKAGKEERLNVISIKLSETQQLEGDALSTAAKEIYKKEAGLYVTIMNTYANRESSNLTGLVQNIAELTEAYSKLGATSVENNAASPAESAEEVSGLKNEKIRLQHELESSQKDNARLENELEETKKEMRETVAEFVSAFSGGRDAAEEKIEKLQQKSAGEQQNEGEPPTIADETPAPAAATAENALENSPGAIAEAETAPTPLPADEIAAEHGAATEIDLTNENEEENTASLAPAAETNPFLSIDDIDSASDDNQNSTESPLNQAMDENDLDADLGLDPPAASDENTSPLQSGETPQTDDIDAILAATAGDELTQPATTTDIAAGEKELDADDIDAILEDIDLSTAEAISDEKKKA